MEISHSNIEPVYVEHLRNEVVEVRRQLFGALAELSSPLGDLVRGQLENSISDLRIGLLLTAARGAETSEQTHQQRLLLGAALEMLYLALSIHKLLLAYTQNNGNHRPERAWTGTVILAGDYCFSRSAILAAQTSLPQVVDIFAHALKTVSEELLRRLFPTASGMLETPFDDERELIGAGLRAATVIARLDEQSATATVGFGQKLIRQSTTTTTRSSNLVEVPLTIAAFQRPYWQAFLSLFTATGSL